MDIDPASIQWQATVKNRAVTIMSEPFKDRAKADGMALILNEKLNPRASNPYIAGHEPMEAYDVDIDPDAHIRVTKTASGSRIFVTNTDISYFQDTLGVSVDMDGQTTGTPTQWKR
jgi:hypothetical protein